MSFRGVVVVASVLTVGGGVAAVARAEKMYWADRNAGRIQRANLDGTSVQTVVSGLLSPRDLTLDVVNGKIYWSEYDLRSLRRSNLDGSNIEDVLIGGPGEPHGLFMDPVTAKIYFADVGTRKIQRMNLDGTAVEDVFNVAVGEAYGLAFDPVTRKMYWTDALTDKITRANLDGTGLQVLVSGLGSLRDIALDVPNGKMYWADTGTDKIQRANFDGTMIEDVLVAPAVLDPSGVAVDSAGEKLYWTDSIATAVRRSNLDGTMIEDVFVEDPASRPTPGPRGISLDLTNGKVYWADVAMQTVRRANLDGSGFEDLAPLGSGRAQGIFVDPADSSIFWTEADQSTGGKIREADLDGFDAVDLLTAKAVSPLGVAIDYETGMVYWSDLYTSRIERASLDLSFVESILPSEGGPRGITIDFVGRKLYWTDINHGKIIRANLDGSSREVIVASGLNGPNAVGVDSVDGKVYWTDPFGRKIQRANLDGTVVENLIVAGLDDPKGIAVDPSGGKFYWVDRGLKRIMRANLDATGIETLVSTGLSLPEGIVLELISFTEQPLSQIVCETDPVTLSVVAAGAPPLGYRWRKNGVDIPGATNATYSIPAAVLDDSGDYDCVVTNTNSQAISDAATVAVTSAPAISIDPQTQSACEQDAVVLSVTVTGDALSYQWRLDGLDIPGETNPTLTLDPVMLSDAGDYDVVVTNLCGSTTSAVATLTVDEMPAVTADPQPLTVCENGQAMFAVTATGTAPLGYQWRKDGVDVPGATSDTLVIDPAGLGDAGDYDVVVTNECAQVISNVATLTVGEAATVATQPATQAACELDSVTFTVTPAGAPPFTYQWRKDGVDIPSETSDTLSIDPVTTGDAGTYDVVVTNSCGQATSTSATLTVDELATIDTQPLSQTVCETDSVTMDAAVSGTAPLTYQWQKDGVDIPGATGTSLTINPVSSADAGAYDVVVTNGCNTVTSGAATLTVDIQPFITTQPISQSGCPDDQVTFSVTADGTAPLSYQWRRNGVDIPGATNNQLTILIQDSSLRGTDTFDVVITNGCGQVISAPATLTVGVGPTITTPPASQSVCDQDTLTLNVSASGTAPLTYQWRKGGADIPGATNDSLVIDPISPADAGDYDVVVTNGCGQATSAAATVTVQTGPTLTLQPVSQSVCEGTAVAMSVSATGQAPITYQWRKDSIDIPGATNSTLNIDPVLLTDAGDYDAVVTDACGQDVSAVATLTVQQGVSITADPLSQSVCVGGSATLMVGAVGEPPLTYQWRKGGVDIPGATSDSLTINPAALGDAGDYDVLVTNGCSQVASAVATLVVGEGPMINTQPTPQAVCDGGSVTFTVDVTGSPTYQWRKNGADIPGETNASLTLNPATTGDAGDYDVVATNGCGQTISAVATLTVDQGPTVSTPPQSQTVCEGASVSLTVTAGGTEPLAYQWRKGGVDIPGETATVLSLDPIALGDAGDYDVVVTNACGQTTSAVATVSVGAAPSVSVQPASQSVCDGGSVMLTVAAEGAAPLTFQWRKGGVDLPGETNDTLTIDLVSPTDAGDYDVVVSNACGQTTSSAATLTIDEGPGIDTQPSTQSVCEGSSATLSVTATGTAPFTYQWRKDGVDIPGETNASLAIDPATPADAGDYDVVITNGCGQTTSAAATLTIQEAASISQQPMSQTVCEGSPVTFTVTAAGTAPITYQWRKGGVDIGGATSDSLSIASATPADADAYDVVVTTGCGAINSSVATLTVDVAPTITLQPQPQSVCQQGQAVFSVTANGTAPLSYQWRLDGADIPGATEDTLIIVVAPNSLRSPAGTYDVVVTNGCGSVMSDPATLFVDEPPTITLEPQGTAVCDQGSVSLSVSAIGTEPFTYQWRLSGADLPGETGSSIVLDPVTPADAGDYDVIVTNECGQATSTTATVVVNTGPSITQGPQPVKICEGSDAVFTVTATGAGKLQYDWFADGLRVGVNSSTLVLAGVSQDDNGSEIVCEVTDDCDTVVSQTAMLLVGPALGNFDCDADVDLQDFSVFTQCFMGSNVPPADGCPAGVDADFDHDGDVDTQDFVLFAQHFTGAR